MQRRSSAHDYRLPGIYHVTIRVAEELWQPLGAVVGNDAASASVALTAAGAAVERELLTAISAHYPMVTVDAYVIMPEHLHFLLIVREPLVSSSGRSAHLGQVIAGFKQGCNRAYWAATGQEDLAAKPQGTVAAKPQGTVATTGATGAATGTVTATGATGETEATEATEATGATGATEATTGASSVHGGFAARKERFSSGRAALFAPGYCDVMPVEAGQLETMRAYIADNPRSRWLRTHDRLRLQPQRGTIVTALTLPALHGYLQRECPPHLFTAEIWGQIEGRLLTANGRIVCDSYGDLTLLQRRLLPVVCHRKDKPLYEQQRERCLTAASAGAMLVSPRIAKGEQNILDAAASEGHPVAIVSDNGFPDVYHPSASLTEHCGDGRLLIVSPWQYQYRGKEDAVSVPFCKTMNCVAQALCRQKDEWWRLEIEH